MMTSMKQIDWNILQQWVAQQRLALKRKLQSNHR